MPKQQMRCFYLFIFCTLTCQLNMEMETNVTFHHALVTGLQNVLLIIQTGLKDQILGQTGLRFHTGGHIFCSTKIVKRDV